MERGSVGDSGGEHSIQRKGRGDIQTPSRYLIKHSRQAAEYEFLENSSGGLITGGHSGENHPSRERGIHHPYIIIFNFRREE